MLTPYQLELLRRAEVEIDEWLDQSPNLKAFLRRIGRAPGAAANGPQKDTESSAD
jgi:hypothetical protein